MDAVDVSYRVALAVGVWAGAVVGLLYLIYDAMRALCLVVSRALAECHDRHSAVSGTIHLGPGIPKATQRSKEVQ